MTAIPAELRALPQWVAWNFKKRPEKSKPDKLPINPHIGKAASTIDPQTWSDYATAVAAVKHYGLAGVGFVFTADDQYTGIDLDNCRDPQTGEIAEWAQEIIAVLHSYSEVSPSKTGVKIFLKGELPENAKHKIDFETGSVEVYDRARFFTVTGEHLPGTPNTVENRQAALTSVYTRVFGSPAAPPRAGAGPSKTPSRHNLLMTRAAQLHSKNLSEEEILACLQADNALLKEPKPEEELRDMVKWIAAKPQQGVKGAGAASNAPALQPVSPTPPLTMSGAEILDWITGFLKKFVSLSMEQARVAALWIVHTHAIDAADCTPYLDINSAEKQSGKTRLLEVSRLLVRGAWFTGRVTAAVLVRKIHAVAPSLLLDESDAAFKGDETYTEALRCVLNTGYRRGGCSSLCVGQGAAMTYSDFSTFCPKAIAGIGRLPDTVVDRSIPIRLKRARRGAVERFRERDAEREAQEHKAQIAAWCEAHVEDLRNARPDIPEDLSDRQADVCEPLLAIADAAGRDWPESARKAVVKLCVGAQADEGSIGVRLLRDIQSVFAGRPAKEIASAELCDALALIETSPWGEWSKGKRLSPAGLSRLLKPFEVYPEPLSTGQVRGYKLPQLEEAFSLYIPPESVKPSEPQYSCGPDADFKVSTENSVRHPENGVSANNNAAPRHFDTLKAGIGVGEEFPLTGSIFTNLVKPAPRAGCAPDGECGGLLEVEI